MPELPEVENLRKALDLKIVGQKINKVIVNKPKLVSGKGNIRIASKKKADEFERGTSGEKIISVERRAKNLIFNLSNNKIILAHLKMSGQFVYIPKKSRGFKDKIIGGHPIKISEEKLPNQHTHIIFELSDGALYYNDTRMFGYLLYYPDTKSFEEKNHFEKYGLEPHDKDFTPKYLKQVMSRKAGKIKSILLSQEVVTGVGNIYCDECLYEASIRPDRPAQTLSNSEINKLHKAIVRIIRRAILLGGSSVASYRLLDNTRGNYAREHKVYGKEGTPCPNCHEPLSKILIQSRTTIFCKNCQK